ncbi:hypothetical protein L1887_62297 [Cichorium endivia]|nr:hypothetical protein L1887_62297 [Cichorium endivia]
MASLHCQPLSAVADSTATIPMLVPVGGQSTGKTLRMLGRRCAPGTGKIPDGNSGFPALGFTSLRPRPLTWQLELLPAPAFRPLPHPRRTQPSNVPPGIGILSNMENTMLNHRQARLTVCNALSMLPIYALARALEAPSMSPSRQRRRCQVVRHCAHPPASIRQAPPGCANLTSLTLPSPSAHGSKPILNGTKYNLLSEDELTEAGTQCQSAATHAPRSDTPVNTIIILTASFAMGNGASKCLFSCQNGGRLRQLHHWHAHHADCVPYGAEQQMLRLADPVTAPQPASAQRHQSHLLGLGRRHAVSYDDPRPNPVRGCPAPTRDNPRAPATGCGYPRGSPYHHVILRAGNCRSPFTPHVLRCPFPEVVDCIT